MMEQPIPLELTLTPAELRLVLKIAEANDQADGRRRVGSIRTRTTLLAKLYTAKDALDGDLLDTDEDTEDTSNEVVEDGSDVGEREKRW